MKRPKDIVGRNRNNYANMNTFKEWGNVPQVDAEIHSSDPKFIRKIGKYLIKAANYIEEIK